ncbi:hypothetical protein SOVF_204990 [Spinacia oleracea]|nr:hypothetical protein SOVF_204990 [Spinacia oleracea]
MKPKRLVFSCSRPPSSSFQSPPFPKLDKAERVISSSTYQHW